jgi:hypothetical protein
VSEQSDVRGPYGVLHRRLWHRADFRALSFEAKAVYCYARTCPAGGLVGIFPLRPEDIRDELGLGARRAKRALAELEAAGFIQRVRNWVWLVSAFEDTPGIRRENAKHRTAALKAVAHVPDELAFAFRNLYGLNTEAPTESDTNPDLYPIHVDVTVTGDGDERTHKEEGIDSSDCPRCGRDACEGCEESVDDRLALLRRQADEITRVG